MTFHKEAKIKETQILKAFVYENRVFFLISHQGNHLINH